MSKRSLQSRDPLSSDTLINLKAVTKKGNETYFKSKLSTPLGRLMKAFCGLHGINDTSKVKFLFDGLILSANQTPAEVRVLTFL